MAYTSITVEGGLFPSDLLDRVASGDATGQRVGDFGIDGHRRLADEIQSAFSDARSFWDAFQRRLQGSRQSPTTITRESWVVPLMERLGFELELQRASAEVGGQQYRISHRAGSDPDAPPVHVVAIEQELDRRNGARRSSHALVQEYLNRSDALWGIVTNGKRLRLLRDTTRFVKPTYLEFDLEGMIEGNLYSEFVLLYRLIHASRFPSDGAAAHECLLESYYQQGIDEGSRVRDKLRDGVEQALRVLGSAFLAHPESGPLRDKFERGQMDAPRYYRQLLRLVYRFLFLMVAEERRLIFPPSDADTARQAVYNKYYSVAQLRDRADRYFAGDHNGDLWLGLRETFRLFRDHDAAQKLGLSALDGELFGPHACEDLEGAACTNEQLLTGVRQLSSFLDDKQRRRVNYAGLDVEEFGSVYESLLEYQPQVSLDPPSFDLTIGSERRQTGSYYTPPDLVRELVDHALVSVMEERLAKAKTPKEKQEALLSLKVCDPAAGSGHFLLAAARRIARELAKVRSGEDEPSPVEYRHGLRDVIRQCVYAVDKNPLAVDLCKVALWIEGHNAGLPLSFLDHHVKCGDSLVGVFDLKVLDEGIPDAAYKPITGGDKTAARYYRDRNKMERAGQVGLTLEEHPDIPHELASELRALAEQEERSPGDVHAKEELYEQLRVRGSEWWKLKVACDLWTYGFFAPMPKMDGIPSPLVPTTDAIRRHLITNSAHPELIGAAVGYSEKHPFIHWPAEFPDVFETGGFDVVIGNPPFLGGKRIKAALGDNYREYVMSAFSPAGGLTDLCGYFFRRAYDLLGAAGHLGLVATNTISQGDTREGALSVIVRTGSITFTRRFVKWPGAANLEVNLLSIRKGGWNGPRILDGQLVTYISSRLDQEPEAQPRRLHRNEAKAFIGSVVLGTGFTMTPDEAQALIRRDARNATCLLPYLTGEDLNSRLEQSPSRWIINFFDWPLGRAEQYGDLMAIVRADVKPQRDEVNRERYRTRWWLYAEACPGLYSAIHGVDRVLVRAQTSDTHAMCFVPNGYVYAMMTVVFAFQDDFHFAILQSSLHEAWVRYNASTMRTDIRYTPSDCFDTFPFPYKPPLADQNRAAQVGAEYHEHRKQVMLARNLGLTKTYNLFHNPECQDEDIVRLRELHA